MSTRPVFDDDDDVDLRPSAAVGHMPFTGHRTVAVLWAKQAASKRSGRTREIRAMSFGFDPKSLKGAA
jgi:hypothetical protein